MSQALVKYGIGKEFFSQFIIMIHHGLTKIGVVQNLFGLFNRPGGDETIYLNDRKAFGFDVLGINCQNPQR